MTIFALTGGFSPRTWAQDSMVQESRLPYQPGTGIDDEDSYVDDSDVQMQGPPQEPANSSRLSDLDGIVQEVMQNYGVPGAALAVAHNGRLVYARGFGFANLYTREQATENTLFNLASCTKAVSMFGVLRLVEAQRLSLDEPMYDAIGRPELPKRRVDPRVFQITIRQLLHHSGGWNDDQGFAQASKEINRIAPQGMPYPDALMVLLKTPLDYTPGTQATYANGQWNLLKFVIECAAGMPYGQFMRRELETIGIHNMHNETREYLPGQAARYQGVPPHELPGGQNKVALEPNFGNWLATAVDMVKFLTAIDGTRMAGISPALFQEMVAPLPPPMVNRPNGSHFGLGLDSVRITPNGLRFSKNGGKPGVHAQIEHLPNNVDYCLLMNGGGLAAQGNPMTPVLKRVTTVLMNVQQWPAGDLFGNYP